VQCAYFRNSMALGNVNVFINTILLLLKVPYLYELQYFCVYYEMYVYFYNCGNIFVDERYICE
jgi:hypothetical protein